MTGSLSDEEQELLAAISEVSRRFRMWIRPDRSEQATADWTEVAGKIHDLQGRVMAASAHRAYPGMFRTIGHSE